MGEDRGGGSERRLSGTRTRLPLPDLPQVGGGFSVPCSLNAMPSRHRRGEIPSKFKCLDRKIGCGLFAIASDNHSHYLGHRLFKEGLMVRKAGLWCALMGGVWMAGAAPAVAADTAAVIDRKSTRLNSSHGYSSYAVF